MSETVRSGIVDFENFQGEEDLLILGMFSAICSAALWLYFATKWSLPVSTTHSIIGSIIGFTVIEKGPDAVKWENVYQIIIWWVGTPLLAAVLVAILFVPLRKLLLRRPSDSYAMTLRWWPFFVFLVLFISIIFLLEKGVQTVGMMEAIFFAAISGVVCAVAAYFLFIRMGFVHQFVQRRVKEKLLKHDQLNKSNEMARTAYGSLAEHEEDEFDGTKQIDVENESAEGILKEKLMHGMNVDILANLTEREQNIRLGAEKFDSQARFPLIELLLSVQFDQ